MPGLRASPVEGKLLFSYANGLQTHVIYVRFKEARGSA